MFFLSFDRRRSARECRYAERLSLRCFAGHCPFCRAQSRGNSNSVVVSLFSAPATRSRGDAGRAEPDRKSTRLNSSHLVISYAVFCLKKNTHDPASSLAFLFHDPTSAVLHA